MRFFARIATVALVALAAFQLPLRADNSDIYLGNSSGYSGRNASSYSGTFNPGSAGSNRYMLVEICVGTNVTVTSATFGGTALSQVGFRTDGTQYVYMYQWNLNGGATPVPTTSGALAVTLTANADVAVAASIFNNVSQTAPHGTVASANGSGSTASVSVTTADRDVVVDAVNAGRGNTTLTPSTAQVLVQSIDSNNNGGAGNEANLGESVREGGTAGSVTMSWSLTKNGNATTDNWIILAMALHPSTTPTAIKLGDFTADRCGETTTLNWRTGFESRNLGFHLYRESNGERTRITPSLVAGSALFSTSGKLASGRPYAWNVASDANAAYWLEEIDTNGQHTLHGPALIREDCSSASSSSPLVSGIDRTKGHVVMRRQSAPSAMASTAETLTTRTRAVASPAAGSQMQGVQFAIAAGAAIKMSVAATGWYRVTGAELLAAGIDASVDPRNLQLFVDGRQQAINVTGADDGKLDATDAIEFYGSGMETYWSDSRVYWLVDGKARGERIKIDDIKAPFAAASGSFRTTIVREDRETYYAELTHGDGENFYGSAFGADAVNETINLRHIDTTSGDAVVEVNVVGLTANDALTPDHGVSVKLNGTPIGTFDFDGFTRGTGRFTVASSLLKEGDNTISLASINGADDFSAVDSVGVTYSHTFVADNDELELSVSSRQTVTIGGFTSNAIRVFDVTDPAAPRELAVTTQGSGSDFAATATLAGNGTRQLLAVTSAKLAHPRAIAANKPSTIHLASNRGAYLMIGHGTLLPSLTPLKSLHESEGLSVASVDIEDVYDEYSFGAKDPSAIKRFLMAARGWQDAPRYVLLAGDSSFDPRNFLGLGEFDLVPSHFISTQQIETLSDDWFVDFDNNGVPDLPIGRFSVRTPAQAANVVSKTVAYAQASSSADWTKQALIVTDANDGTYDFEGSANRMAALLQPNGISTTIDKLSAGASKSQILSQINSGELLVEYIGHGSVEQWSDTRVITSSDAQSMTNGTKLPVVIAMTCLNGLFHDVYTTSLAEALMNATNGGAVAVWSSSSLTPPDGQSAMGEALIRALFATPRPTLGEAMRQAKQQTANADVRASWILLGDPALKLK